MSDEKLSYTAKGFVYGHCWGGGEAAYPSTSLRGETKDSILEQAEKGLDGSLDGGMGFESLVGALLFVTKITTIKRGGKEFTNKETESEFVGELTEEQKSFLLDLDY